MAESAEPKPSRSTPRVQTGLERLLSLKRESLRGKRLGLLTHAAATTATFRTGIDLLAETGFLQAVFAPEHGLQGNAQAGEHVPLQTDPATGIPIFSLYGQDIPSPEANDRDAYMRDFDRLRKGKEIGAAMLEKVDLLLCDLQDIGTRVYTYAATMILAMENCAARDIPFIVLDRPNPLNGTDLEGPILETPHYQSFVGLLPIPMRHGLTMGELARFAARHFLTREIDLEVIPMLNWRRSMGFASTGLPWIPPSPNMPTLDTALVYPGQVLFEGTNVSEGRGTTRPFETIGAPWLDGKLLADRFNRETSPGVLCRETSFTPTFSKYTGRSCSGVQLHITDRRRFRPFATSIRLIELIRSLHPADFRFHNGYFDAMAGNGEIRNALTAGAAAQAVVAASATDLDRFRCYRHPFLLYR